MFCFVLFQELAHSPVLSYDPLPPQDAIVSYTRPDRSVEWTVFHIGYYDKP